MRYTCPTVKIRNGDGGFTVINENDYDPAVHELYDDAEDGVSADTDDTDNGANKRSKRK